MEYYSMLEKRWLIFNFLHPSYQFSLLLPEVVQTGQVQFFHECNSSIIVYDSHFPLLSIFNGISVSLSINFFGGENGEIWNPSFFPTPMCSKFSEEMIHKLDN
jgi:hypothetical protein